MEEIGEISVNEFPWDLTEDLGDILTVERLCPDVYYVCAQGGTQPGTEFYAVAKDTDAISKEAKSYGTVPDDEPDSLLFPFGKERGGREIVRYEIQRYYMRNGLPASNLAELQDAAAYGAEIYPEYFGPFFPSRNTPRGSVIRYKMLMNGVFWAETDIGDTMIEVSYPLWLDVFSSHVLLFSLHESVAMGVVPDNFRGSLCFKEEAIPLVIFELCQHFSGMRESKLIDNRALMNVLYRDHRDYVVTYNTEEQLGLHDSTRFLKNVLGVDADLESRPENMVSICPEAGFEYLKS